MSTPNTYTCFCQEANGQGTIWIESFEADSTEAAIEEAQKLCAEAWEYDPDDVHVLGIVAGNVEVLHWEDLNCN